MTKEEALQMCLEYIETNAHERRCVRWAIKDALAQPTSGYAKKIQELIQERDALRALAQPDERNFCPRCGKRTADLTTIHTCTPPQTIADEHIAKVTSDIDLAVNKALVDEDDDIQAKPWVGLTDEERFEIRQRKWWDWEDAFDIDGFMQAIEIKLKEKNT